MPDASRPGDSEWVTGDHLLVGRLEGDWTCVCGTIAPSQDERDPRIHIEWALRRQLEQLWNAAQRVANDTGPDTLAALGRALDACRPEHSP